jgi:hypothetical protein
VRWQASDADGDPLVANVLYSHANGQTWIPLDVFVEETEVVRETAPLPAGTRAMVKVSVSDGMNTTSAIVGDLQLTPNRAPRVYIVAPADGESWVADTNAILLGGDDPEDGVLADTAFAWFSNLDGYLGSGSLLNTKSGPSLSVGNHTLTLVVTDSAGASDSASLEVSVLP